MHEYTHIKYEENRVFIDVAQSGCGFGCKYCYTPGKLQPQQFLIKELFLESLYSVVNDKRYKEGMFGTVITLSPNTEPLKDEQSQDFVNEVLKLFLPKGNHIQIATKGLINSKLLSTIAKNAQHEDQIILYISLPTISHQAKNEPYARPLSERLQNFKLTRELNIKNCLYIKPFLARTGKDIDKFKSLIGEINPDFICSGVRVSEKDNFTVLYKDHNKYRSVVFDNNNKGMLTFTKQLSTITNRLVFNCSSCITAYIRKCKPFPAIFSTHPGLCIKCHKYCFDQEGETYAETN
jgi:DNA repair photolyase